MNRAPLPEPDFTLDGDTTACYYAETVTRLLAAAQPQPEAQGVAILVDGAVVAWFAELDEHAGNFCQEAWFGRWLTWRATPPQLIPLTPTEYAEAQRRGKELHAKLRFDDDAQAKGTK